MSPEHLDFVRAAAHEGIFVHPSVRVWKPKRRMRMYALQGVPGVAVDDTVGIERRFRIPRLRKSARLQSACILAIRNLSYRTIYGNFVPARNIERFAAEMEEFREKLADARDEVVADFDNIMKSAAKQAEKLAVLEWTGKHGYEGTPHRRFVEKYVEDYLDSVGTRDDVAARFRFRILPCHPLVLPGSPYAEMYGEEHNTAVYENIFERLLCRRRALIQVLTDSEEMLVASPPAPSGTIYYTLLVKLRGYVWAFFYREQDPDLVPMIEQLRALLIVNDEERNKDAVLSDIRRIRTHLVENEFFRTGMEVANG